MKKKSKKEMPRGGGDAYSFNFTVWYNENS